MVNLLLVVWTDGLVVALVVVDLGPLPLIVHLICFDLTPTCPCGLLHLYPPFLATTACVSSLNMSRTCGNGIAGGGCGVW